MSYSIVILGAGESGVGAALLAKQKGFEVFVSDASEIKAKYKEELNLNKIDWEEKTHTESIVFSVKEIIKSPGIPQEASIIRKAKEKNISIISEIEFASRYTQAKKICITGSNGKTTTSKLVYHILQEANLDVGIAGNIGNSMSRLILEREYEYLVLELSSFQLDDMHAFKAEIAVLLNISPDHLDRYNNNYQNYIDSKFKIIKNQSKEDVFIYWNEDLIIREELAKKDVKSTLYSFGIKKQGNNSSYIKDEFLIINTLKTSITMSISKLSLSGIHNTYNSMAAGISACVMDIKKENIRKSLGNFTGVEHRLEYVATVRGIKFINDSKATNVNSCWYALKSVQTPVVLIIGGVDKGNDYSEIEKEVLEKVHTLICMGTDNSLPYAFFKDKVSSIHDTKSIKEAVKLAYQSAEKGDTVLLSPCCASFDLFEDFEDRGNQFKEHVRNL